MGHLELVHLPHGFVAALVVGADEVAAARQRIAERQAERERESEQEAKRRRRSQRAARPQRRRGAA